MSGLVRRLRNTAFLLLAATVLGFGSSVSLEARTTTWCYPDYDEHFVEFTSNDCDFWEADPCFDGGWLLCAMACQTWPEQPHGEPYTYCSSSGEAPYVTLLYMYCNCS